jgi:hypothetical protein
MRLYKLLLLLFPLLLPTLNACCHALHPDSIDRYAHITLTPNNLVIIYELLLGKNPTAWAMRKFDADKDGTITDQERDEYVSKAARKYADNQTLSIGQTELEFQFVQGDAYESYGHNGMSVVKIDIAYKFNLPADIPREATISLNYKDDNLLVVPGWKQVGFSTIGGVVYSGHIPYKDVEKFDFPAMELKGYFPATESIDIEINLPKSGVEDVAASIQMPEKKEQIRVYWDSDKKIVMVIWGILVVFLVVIGVLYIRSRRVQNDLDRL